MTTIVIWLLISTSSHNQSNVVARFATKADCEEARAAAIRDIPAFYKGHSGCIQARVLP